MHDDVCGFVLVSLANLRARASSTAFAPYSVPTGYGLPRTCIHRVGKGFLLHLQKTGYLNTDVARISRLISIVAIRLPSGAKVFKVVLPLTTTE